MVQNDSMSHQRPGATTGVVEGPGGRRSSAAPQTQPGLTTGRPHHNNSARESLPTQPGAAHAGMDSSETGSSRPAIDVSDRGFDGIILQPETRPFRQEQLVQEVKGIYAGLVMVERKCVEIDQQQAMTTAKLSNEQWQALIALHRTLLHEHHDFLASQHPSASPALRRLATKYATPARMWRHGVHSFLELLRHRLLDSLDHMLSFLYLAYFMMALLTESVPNFEETWIECFGDLARYRMAIEEADLHDREIWSGVARIWYDKAAGRSPNVRRIQHHLDVLARPNIIQQLSYAAKALARFAILPNARESIMLLLNPFFKREESTSQSFSVIEYAFVRSHTLLFTHGSITESVRLTEEVAAVIDNRISIVTRISGLQETETANILCTSLFDFGEDPDERLLRLFKKDTRQRATSKRITQISDFLEEFSARKDATRSYYRSVTENPSYNISPHDVENAASQSRHMLTPTLGFSAPHDVHDHRSRLSLASGGANAALITDEHIFPFTHIGLAFLKSLAFVPGALRHVGVYMPWAEVVSILNTLGMSVVAKRQAGEFPMKESGTRRQLPEDFVMRGLIWSLHVFPAEFFSEPLTDKDKAFSQPVITRTQRDESGIPSQNSTAHLEYGGLEQGDCTEPTTVSRRRSDKGTFTLRKVSHTFFQLAPTYFALRWIPVALAQDDCDDSQMSTGSKWIILLFLASAAGIAGQMTKGNPSHAFGLSAWMICAIAVAWDHLDLATTLSAVAVGLAPLLAVGLDQIRKRWHENDFPERGEDAYPDTKSDISMMEEGDLDTQHDDDYDPFHWTDAPRQHVEITENNLVEEASRIDQDEDRDSSPEPWNGTEGFQR
jgi:hypothetical protein